MLATAVWGRFPTRAPFDYDCREPFSKAGRELMSRLSVLGNEQLAPEMRKQAEAADQAGASSTVLRVLGHRPEMFEAYFRFYYPMHNGGVVPPELKEMVRLRIAELNQCLT